MNNFPDLEKLVIKFKLNNIQTGRLLGVSPHTVGKWRRGERSPTTSAVSLVKLLLFFSTFCPGLVESFIRKAR